MAYVEDKYVIFYLWKGIGFWFIMETIFIICLFNYLLLVCLMLTNVNDSTRIYPPVSANEIKLLGVYVLFC